MPLGGWSVFPDPAGPSWQVPAGLSWQVPAGRSSPESGPDRGTAEPPWPSCTALRDARAKVRTLVFSRRRRGSPGEGQARGGDDEVGRPKVEAAERRDLEAGGVDDGEVVPVPGAAPPVEVARGIGRREKPQNEASLLQAAAHAKARAEAEAADARAAAKAKALEAQEEGIPLHIQAEYKAMLATLHKTIDCPVCLDVIPTADIAFTPCGHKFCQPCLAGLKREPVAKCALCRRRLKRGRAV